MHDDEPVAHLKKFVEIFGNKKDRGAGCPALAKEIARRDGRRDVHPSRWIETHQESWLPGEFTRQYDALHIASHSSTGLLMEESAAQSSAALR